MRAVGNHHRASDDLGIVRRERGGDGEGDGRREPLSVVGASDLQGEGIQKLLRAKRLTESSRKFPGVQKNVLCYSPDEST